MPMIQTLLLDIYPKSQMAKAMSILGITTVFGPVIGLTLGGYLTDEVGWRWIFLINLPIAALALFVMFVFLPRSGAEVRQRRFDFIGFGFFALATVQLMLDRGPAENWFEANEIVVYALIVGLAFYFFVVHSAYREQPFFDPAMFRDRNFMSTLGLNFAVGIGMCGPLTLLPLFLQNAQQHTAFQTGMIMMPRALMMSLPMLFMARIVEWASPKAIIFAGICCSAIGLYFLGTITADTPAWIVVVAGSIHAVGMSSIFVPVNLVAFSTLEAHLRPMASALMMLTRNFGASMGLAFLMGYISDSTDMNYLRLIENLSPFNPNMEHPWLPSMWSLDNPVLLKLMSMESMRQATVIAYDNAFVLLSFIALASSVLLLFVGRVERESPPEVEEPPGEAL